MAWVTEHKGCSLLELWTELTQKIQNGFSKTLQLQQACLFFSISSISTSTIVLEESEYIAL